MNGFEKITSITYQRITLASTVQFTFYCGILDGNFGPYYLQLVYVNLLCVKGLILHQKNIVIVLLHI